MSIHAVVVPIVARRAARELIDAVLENMRQNLEPLKYSTLAPSRYLVYLHPQEYSRLEGIIPILQQQTIRALNDELSKLNRLSQLRQYVPRFLGGSDPLVQSAGMEWHVEFLADPNSEIAEGDVLVDSELLLPASPELGVGERTRKITTVKLGHQTTAREQTATRPLASARTLARIAYDDAEGRHVYEMAKDSVSIGRGGVALPVDVRIVSSADVSREHARIRRDTVTGRFFLVDLSSLGTTLNGRHVPRGYEQVESTRRENGAETPLPDRARIGLADTVYLEFEAVR